MVTSADARPASATSDPATEAAKRLFERVIYQAVDDGGVPTWRDDVEAFFAGPAFARYCALLGWSKAGAWRRVEGLITRRPPAG
jgi:hypothetical protein